MVYREEKSTLLKVKINIRSFDCLKRMFMFHVDSRLFNGTFAFDESKMEQKRPVQTMRTRKNRDMWSLIRPLSALFKIWYTGKSSQHCLKSKSIYVRLTA